MSIQTEDALRWRELREAPSSTILIYFSVSSFLRTLIRLNFCPVNSFFMPLYRSRTPTVRCDEDERRRRPSKPWNLSGGRSFLVVDWTGVRGMSEGRKSPHSVPRVNVAETIDVCMCAILSDWIRMVQFMRMVKKMLELLLCPKLMRLSSIFTEQVIFGN